MPIHLPAHETFTNLVNNIYCKCLISTIVIIYKHAL
ncbi:unnamed protein product [Amoebophrya sp. A25]|nr:unnamed protein product [Amoebophrya sp. A25]CAD7976196.1 unnamed protein product [Amoebophrya sp. A25]|eukprot:GSA25T00013856001.1